MANDPHTPPNRLVDPNAPVNSEGQKTRVVMRNDIIDQTIRAPTASGSPTDGAPVEPTRQLGTAAAAMPQTAPGVLGKTRLIGGGTEMPPPARMAGGPTQGGGGGGPAKTQYLRPGDMKTDPVVAWLVVFKGPGRGNFRPVYTGMNSLGRDPSQRICMDFGDDSISREEHAFITYDEEQRVFFVQHGGKSNLVRLNNTPVLTPTQLNPADLIRIGKTTLRFVPLCGPDFSWSDDAGED